MQVGASFSLWRTHSADKKKQDDYRVLVIVAPVVNLECTVVVVVIDIPSGSAVF
jgi:hypothetical protein